MELHIDRDLNNPTRQPY